MLNNIILVGRLTSKPNMIETLDNDKYCEITLAVQRNFKDSNNNYIVDFIPCVLWNSIATNSLKHLKEHDIIGVKGRLQSNEDKSIVVIAEKITFLSSKQTNE